MVSFLARGGGDLWTLPGEPGNRGASSRRSVTPEGSAEGTGPLSRPSPGLLDPVFPSAEWGQECVPGLRVFYVKPSPSPPSQK